LVFLTACSVHLNVLMVTARVLKVENKDNTNDFSSGIEGVDLHDIIVNGGFGR
jgi:hypothetical protein